MKKAGRKLIVSVFVLVVAMSLAVTSTFAWFTMTNTPSVDGFNVNVTTSEGLLISLTGADGTYKSRFTKSEIEAAIGTVYLSPVTSTDGIAMKDLAGQTAATSSYVSFDLHFFSSTLQSVKLNSTGNSVTSVKNPSTDVDFAKAWKTIDASLYSNDVNLLNPSNGVVDEDGEIKTGADIIAKAQNAVRISFVNGASAVTWYPNIDKGFNLDYNFLQLSEGFEPKNLGLEYFNHVSDTAYLATSFPEIFSTSWYDGTYIADNTLITLAPAAGGGFKATLTIKIWIEGYDGDCFDSIMDDILTIALKFQGVV